MEHKKMNAEKDMNILSEHELNMPKLRGLGSTLYYKMLEYKDLISVTCGMTAHNETYEQLLQDSIIAANAMRQRGIKPNDVITLCSQHFPDCITVYCASLFIGAKSANIDPDLSIPEVTNILKQICPKMIFADSSEIKLIKLSLRESGIDVPIIVELGIRILDIPFPQFLLKTAPEKDFIPFEIENLRETANIVFTSGTTGLVKAACLSHYGLLGHMYNSISSVLLNIPHGFNVLIFNNLYWMSSITITIFSIINGCNQILFPKFDAELVWNLIEEHKANLMLLTPCQILEVCKNGRPENANTSSLQFLLLTGDPITKEQIKHIKKCLPETLIVNCYSQTEQNGAVLTFRSTDKKLMEEKLNSVGKPIPGYTYKIVNLETEEILGPNQKGELCIKSEFSMNSYCSNTADSSCDVWDCDGFIKTGDIAYYDVNHCFFIQDRINDLIQYKTWHISPAKVEAYFYTNVAVYFCVVIGIPQYDDGNHLMGIVQLKEEAVGKILAEDLEKFVNEKVGEEEKIRAGVKIVQKIPLTITDKISRRKIKQFILEGKI